MLSDELATATEGVEADGDERMVTHTGEVIGGRSRYTIAKRSRNIQCLARALWFEAPGTADGEVDIDIIGRVAQAEQVVDLANARELALQGWRVSGARFRR